MKVVWGMTLLTNYEDRAGTNNGWVREHRHSRHNSVLLSGEVPTGRDGGGRYVELSRAALDLFYRSTISSCFPMEERAFFIFFFNLFRVSA